MTNIACMSGICNQDQLFYFWTKRDLLKKNHGYEVRSSTNFDVKNNYSHKAGVLQLSDLTHVLSRLSESCCLLPKPVLFDINVYRGRHRLQLHIQLDADWFDYQWNGYDAITFTCKITWNQGILKSQM